MYSYKSASVIRDIYWSVEIEANARYIIQISTWSRNTIRRKHYARDSLCCACLVIPYIPYRIDIFTVCPAVCPGAHKRKHQSSTSLVFVRGIHRWPVESNDLVTYTFIIASLAIAPKHYNDVIRSAMAYQITSPTVVYSTVYSDADQR